MSRYSPERQQLILKGIRDLPSLPEIVNKIVHKLALPNTPASEIAKLIGYDPGLTSKVLRMVNSAAYGLQRQISSIQHGIMILGFNTVRGLVLSASIFKLIESDSARAWDYKQFWTHSMLTAICTRQIAQELRLPDAEDAFSAGMLHDIGTMILNVYFRNDYDIVLAAAHQANIPEYGRAFLNLEKDILGTSHTAVGLLMANKWKLPIAMAEVIQHHHEPESAKLCQPLVYAASLANELVHHPLLLTEETIEPSELSPEPLVYLGIDSIALESIITCIREEAQNTDDLLGAINPVS